KTIFQALGDEGKLLLGIFALYYTIDFLFDFIGTGKYQNEEMSDLMFRPYGRIFVQQFVVILGGFFLLFKANSLFIILFIGIKIFFEYLVTTGNFLPARNKNKWNAAYEEH